MRFDTVFADLGGVAPERLSDPQSLAGLLLAAANAAGLSPVTPPAVTPGGGPTGVGVALICHGGHITLHAAPAEGLCFVDVAGLGGTHPQRGLDVIIKRLGAREVRSDARRRGPVIGTLDPERT